MGKTLATLTIDACAGCCGTLGLSWHCESLTGTASLCGISAYSADASPYDAGDPDAWEGQFRKWLNRDLAGSMTVQGGPCASCVDPTSGGNRGIYTFSGTYSVTCDDVTYGVEDRQQSLIGSIDCAEFSSVSLAASTVNTGGFDSLQPTCPADGTGFDAPARVTRTLTVLTAEGCGCYASTIIPFYIETLGSATEELREEVYFYDALLATGTAEEGELCCTSLTESDRTTPESISPMSMTGTAVKVPISILNGADGVVYLVTVTLSQANLQPDDPMEPPVPPTIWDETIEVETGITTNYYPRLPIPGDFPICVISVVLGDPV